MVYDGLVYPSYVKLKPWQLYLVSLNIHRLKCQPSPMGQGEEKADISGYEYSMIHNDFGSMSESQLGAPAWNSVFTHG